MPPVAVVSDSTNYLPRALADSQGIHQVSLYVGWGGQPERELDMPSFDPFYERLRKDPESPTTSQPSIGDFLAVWEPLLDEGHDIVSVHLAGGISGTGEAARQAQGVLVERGVGERVEVLDGETACGGLGLLLLSAAAAARAGADMQAVVERVREARKALRMWFCLDTLEFLRKGGRIGKAQAWLGGSLKIKTLLSRRRRRRPRRTSIRTPTAAAPMASSRWWLCSCARQSVMRATSPRRRSTETPSSWRLASIELRISVVERCAISDPAPRPDPGPCRTGPSPCRTGAGTRRPCAVAAAAGVHGVADFACLLDRHVGHGRGALLYRARGEQPREDAEHEQDGGHREEAPEEGEGVDGQQVVDQQRKPDEHEEEGRDEKDPGGYGDDCAARELGDLLGDLGLGELDLLAHKQAGAFGDLGDRGGDVLRLLPARRSLLLGLAHSGGSSSKRRRQSSPAARCATMLDSAPRPASRPDHINRLTMSFSIQVSVLPTVVVS